MFFSKSRINQSVVDLKVPDSLLAEESNNYGILHMTKYLSVLILENVYYKLTSPKSFSFSAITQHNIATIPAVRFCPKLATLK